ncbi:MAG: 50S ribosomal protein L11 methyltransferase [Candidatus Latescibacterota bacterium]
MPKQIWRSVLIECEPGSEDMVSSLIFEAGFSGLEEHTVAGRTRFTAFYSPEAAHNPLDVLRKLLEKYRRDRGHDPARILTVENVPDADWEAKWREGLDAVEAGKRLVVRPSWVEYENREGRIEIIIDPKMAFGTGGHATTHLCLEALERIDPAGKTALDAGCGSGVLSIAAAKLGAVQVFGFDHDPFSIENANENILLNGVSDRVKAALADLNEISPDPADILLANLISGVLIAFLDKFRSLLNPGGIAVFSGILAEEEDRFTVHLRAHGFRILSVEHRDEWIAILADVFV